MALPTKLGMYEVDFFKVRQKDISLKKGKPMWSGQDVLRDHMDYSSSLWVVNHLNMIRVWPIGVFGYYKRWRYYLRKLVLSSFYEGFMTFAVLLNTIVLAMDHHGISPDMSDMLDLFNSWFTWIFIFEFCSWILAIGDKYFAQPMNWLDCGVVWLSIFEMVMAEILKGGQGMSLKAFKTLRMLRTFRVFRIARLLKALKSMQTIINVIRKSYMSFVYITMLMILFIVIFSLLGTQMFGGQFGDDVDSLPRGNYDTFGIAFITVFQILTMENWQTVLFDSMATKVSAYGVAIFYISWIFLGNFILLNLFLAILLDSFLEEDEEEEDEQEQKLKAKAKAARLLLR